MSALFEVKPVDRAFYESRLRDFLPARIIDMHTHVWLSRFRAAQPRGPRRTVTWPGRVAAESPIEDLLETYRLMFPDKRVTPLIFSSVSPGGDLDAANAYISECARRHALPALIWTRPQWSAAELEARVQAGGFLGAKSYLSFADPALGVNDISIFDFLPPHQLDALDRHGWIAMLHIPRDGRLRDPVNLEQMREIERRWPGVRLIIAHVGRAYCPEDVGNAFEALAETRRLSFDISANTNARVFAQLIRAVGPRRILFGSDLPILRMRTRRVCEAGNYVNLVPRGLYGDVSGDSHMREVEDDEAERLTFFMYEEIDAFRRAAIETGLKREDVEAVFFGNAARLLEEVGWAGATW
ncbi:MAG: amidohydrolase family protein [Armatimonadetes bacterium]|nr:amidohydrolase family protein [Armatimonadota bacterium]